jgi:hypothetical protein
MVSVTTNEPVIVVSTFISRPLSEIEAVADPDEIRNGSKSIAVAVIFCNPEPSPTNEPKKESAVAEPDIRTEPVN